MDDTVHGAVMGEVGSWQWQLAVAVGSSSWQWQLAVAVGSGSWQWQLAVDKNENIVEKCIKLYNAK